MGTYLSTPVLDKHTETGRSDPSGPFPVSWAVVDMQGWRKTMEDAHVATANVSLPNGFGDNNNNGANGANGANRDNGGEATGEEKGVEAGAGAGADPGGGAAVAVARRRRRKCDRDRQHLNRDREEVESEVGNEVEDATNESKEQDGSDRGHDDERSVDGEEHVTGTENEEPCTPSSSSIVLSPQPENYWDESPSIPAPNVSSTSTCATVPDKARVFAVFDGHGGPEVARFCQLYLVDVLVRTDGWRGSAIADACDMGGIHDGMRNGGGSIGMGMGGKDDGVVQKRDEGEGDATPYLEEEKEEGKEEDKKEVEEENDIDIDNDNGDENNNEENEGQALTTPTNETRIAKQTNQSPTIKDAAKQKKEGNLKKLMMNNTATMETKKKRGNKELRRRIGEALVDCFHAVDRMIDDPKRRDEIALLRVEKPRPGEMRSLPVEESELAVFFDAVPSAGDASWSSSSVPSPSPASADAVGMDGPSAAPHTKEASVSSPDAEAKEKDGAKKPTTDGGGGGRGVVEPDCLDGDEDDGESSSGDGGGEKKEATPSATGDVDASPNDEVSGEREEYDGEKAPVEGDEDGGDTEGDGGKVNSYPDDDDGGDEEGKESEGRESDSGGDDDDDDDDDDHVQGEGRGGIGVSAKDAMQLFHKLLTGQSMTAEDVRNGGNSSENSRGEGSTAETTGPSVTQPMRMHNGRQVCNLPDHPVHAGCTAVVAVLVGNILTVANAGDSRAVLCREGGRTEALSFDHKPLHESERRRITEAGGFVNQFGRVNGNLNLSRSIGDLKYKQVPGIPPSGQMITAEPDITQVVLNPGRDEFILLGCDGIWDCLSNEEAVRYVRERIDTMTPAEIVTEMLDDIVSEDPRASQGIGGDNMTLMIVDLLPTTRSYFNRGEAKDEAAA